MSAKPNRARRRWWRLIAMGMERSQSGQYLISAKRILAALDAPTSVAKGLRPLPTHDAFWVLP